MRRRVPLAAEARPGRRGPVLRIAVGPAGSRRPELGAPGVTRDFERPPGALRAAQPGGGDPKRPSSRDRSAILLGLGLSAAMHGALLAFAVAFRPEPVPEPEAPVEPVEIVILELPPLGRVAAPLVTPRQERPASAAPQRTPAAARQSRGESRPGEAAAVRSGAPGAASADGSSWLFAPQAPPSLGLSARDVTRLGGVGAGVGPGPERGEVDTAAQPREAQQRVQAMLDEARAAYQAQMPDAYWIPVRDGMAERFVPTWTVFDAQGSSRATSIGKVLSGYLDTAGRYGRAETAGGRRRAAPGSAPGGEVDAPLDDGNPFFRELVVLVRVVQRLDGALERVELVQSCGYRELDRMALDAARAAVEGHAATATPPQGRRTLWAFKAHYEVIPPAPVVGCPLDAIWTADFSRCAWPLKRSATARVELRGID
jgi:outer membrane biosynthesis protein TonB